MRTLGKEGDKITNGSSLTLNRPQSVQTASKAKAAEEMKGGPPGTYDIPHQPSHILNGQVGMVTILRFWWEEANSFSVSTAGPVAFRVVRRAP